MGKSTKQALRELAAEYGIGILEDTDRLAQFLEDRGGESSEEILRLIFALRYLMKEGWGLRTAREHNDVLYTDGLIKDLGFTALAAKDIVTTLRSIIAESAETVEERDDSRVVAVAGNLCQIAGGVANRPRTMWLRRKSMRNGLVLIAVLAAIAVLFFQIGGQRNPVGDELRIAFLTRMSGPSSQSGLNQLRAVQLAVENINKQGGIRGYKFRVVGFDLPVNSSEAKKSFEAIMRDQSIVSAISGVGGAAGRSICPVADAVSVPLVIAAPDVYIGDESGRPFMYVFGIANNSDDRARMMAYFMTQELANKKTAVIYELNKSFTAADRDQFLRRVKSLGGEVVANISFTQRIGAHYTPMVKAVRESGAEVLMFPGRNKRAAAIITALRAGGFTAPIIGENYTETISASAGEAMAGSWWINEISSLDPQIRSVLREYRSLFNENVPPDDIQEAVLAYDAMIWLAHAFYIASGYRGEAIRHALLSTRNFPMTHATLTIDPRTHGPYKKAMTVIYCEGGTGIFQKRIRPEGSE